MVVSGCGFFVSEDRSLEVFGYTRYCTRYVCSLLRLVRRSITHSNSQSATKLTCNAAGKVCSLESRTQKDTELPLRIACDHNHQRSKPLSAFFQCMHGYRLINTARHLKEALLISSHLSSLSCCRFKLQHRYRLEQ
jgi:hypothetical protein